MIKKVTMIKRMALLCILVLLFSSFLNAAKAVNYLSTWLAHDIVNNVDQGYFTEVAFWSSSPKVCYDKLDPSNSFAFLSGLINGKDEWNAALGTTVSVSSNYTNAEIFYYGGTIDDINDLNLFAELYPGSNVLGYTNWYNSGFQHWECEYLYQSSNVTYHIDCYEQLQILGYVISSDRTYNQYLKTCTHELGHAMGWRGHAAPSNTNWVMWQGVSSVTSLSTSEKAHLTQIYNDQLGG